ncbi:hypothetical protein BV22DRAFT_138573 [Leucogyrophana mollusca]|uniref:Uncharacterized protein n=1 Tax=Leucogyrophana mollusca TaxID=85980 RepID=A0ACB8BUW5_9AGAM|nr:hypothetical protein BV22DRAFT_138573 [Leucogyrophana mollusca]
MEAPLAPVGTVSINVSAGFDGLYYGFMMATILSGISIVQGWVYLNSCDKDHWGLRSFVGIMVLADLVTTSLDLKVMHFCLIENFGWLPALTVITRPVTLEFILTVITVYCVQLFFASRIYLFKKQSVWLSAIIVFFGTGAVIAGVSGAGLFFHHDEVSFLATRKNKILFGINGGCAAIADIVITVVLTWTLSSAKRGFKRTDTMLQKLLLYVVSRGLLVTVTQILFLIIYFIRPDQLYWVPLHFISSKLYVITMVAMLNARRCLREEGDNIFTTSSLSFANSGSRDQRIMVHKTVELSHYQDESEITEMSTGNKGANTLIQEHHV